LGCLLLLLVRGALSMLNTQSRVPTTASGVDGDCDTARWHRNV